MSFLGLSSDVVNFALFSLTKKHSKANHAAVAGAVELAKKAFTLLLIKSPLGA